MLAAPSDPVFRSVHQALHVAFLMAILPPTQKSNTQALIEQLMRDAGVTREVEMDGTLNFQGLSPLEVRGQCAMVRGAVIHHCTEPERMAIWAWFAHDASKAQGVRYLRDYFGRLWTVESPQARMLMTWRASVTDDSKAAKMCSYRDIEGEHGIPKSTAQRQVQAMAKAAKRLREHGAGRLEALFVAHGLVIWGVGRMIASYLLPIKTVTGLNAREHWRVRHKRVQAERHTTASIVKPFPTPCIVRMVRLSPSLCDDDNLQGACKAIRDEIAKLCGVDDGPRGPITWAYAQEKCKRGQFGVRVEFLAI